MATECEREVKIQAEISDMGRWCGARVILWDRRTPEIKQTTEEYLLNTSHWVMYCSTVKNKKDKDPDLK